MSYPNFPWKTVLALSVFSTLCNGLALLADRPVHYSSYEDCWITHHQPWGVCADLPRICPFPDDYQNWPAACLKMYDATGEDHE